MAQEDGFRIRSLLAAKPTSLLLIAGTIPHNVHLYCIVSTVDRALTFGGAAVRVLS